jgi:hypothetical protein
MRPSIRSPALADGQAKARAGVAAGIGAIGLEEAVEQALKVLRRDADAGVVDRKRSRRNRADGEGIAPLSVNFTAFETRL